MSSAPSSHSEASLDSTEPIGARSREIFEPIRETRTTESRKQRPTDPARRRNLCPCYDGRDDIRPAEIEQENEPHMEFRRPIWKRPTAPASPTAGPRVPFDPAHTFQTMAHIRGVCGGLPPGILRRMIPEVITSRN